MPGEQRIAKFAQNIWLADGGAVNAIAGFHYPTRMAVMRLQGGDLAVWSPIELTAPLLAEVHALGDVAHILAPNTLHHLFVPEWVAAFPAARLYGAPGLAAKRPDLRFDHIFGEQVDLALAHDLEQVVIDEHAITTEVVFFHRVSGTVLFTDLIQHLPKGWFRGWRALVARLDLMTGAEPAVPRKFRMGFKDKARAREAVGRILAWPAKAVVFAHGSPVTLDAPAFLRRAFAWLMKG